MGIERLGKVKIEGSGDSSLMMHSNWVIDERHPHPAIATTPVVVSIDLISDSLESLLELIRPVKNVPQRQH